MEMMTKQVELIRYDGSWSWKDSCRKMTMMDAVNWLNRNGYKLRKAWDRKCGIRVLEYRKPGCKTGYTMNIPA